MRTRFFILTIAAVFALCVALPLPQLCAQEDYGSTPYDDDDGERNIAPWVIGGVLIGGGTAAAIALSDDDDDDDDDDATPAPDPDPADPEPECEEGDMLGTWDAPDEVAGPITTSYSFTLQAGGSATFSTVTQDEGPPPTAMGAAAPGTWSLSGCTLTLNGPAPMDGSGTVSGGSVSIGGRTFSK